MRVVGYARVSAEDQHECLVRPGARSGDKWLVTQPDWLSWLWRSRSRWGSIGRDVLASTAAVGACARNRNCDLELARVTEACRLRTFFWRVEVKGWMVAASQRLQGPRFLYRF